MAKALRTDRMKTYAAKIKHETELYFENVVQDCGTLSLKQAACEVTINTASKALLGDEVRNNLHEQVAQLYSDLDGGTTVLSVFFPYAPTPNHKRRDKAQKAMVELFKGVIKQRRESGVSQDDSLQTFMDAKYKDTGKHIPDEHICGLLIGLLFAGQHTSSITIMWTVMYILSRPEIYEDVMKEQRAILGDDLEGELSFERLNEMEVLHSCIKEGLRLNPPLIYVMREVLQDVKCGKYTIPKGDLVFCSPAVAGRREEAWADANDFKPERFYDGREPEEKKAPFTYASFGGGIHGCMGQQYAYLQVKTVLSVLFKNFDVEMLEKQMPKPDFEQLVVPPQGPCMAKLTRKTKISA